jgi:ubiquitin C-terminal hydrolase
MECEQESGRPEAFFDISLPIERGSDLPTLLSRYFAKSILGGEEKYDCDSCRHMNEAFHYQRISKLPKVLTIHLKRFSWSTGLAAAPASGYALRSAYAPTGAGKLNFHIECPFELQIARSWLTTELQKEFLRASLSASNSSLLAPRPNHLAPTPNFSDSSTQEPATLSVSGEELRISRNMLLSAPADSPLARYQLYAVIFHTGSSTTFGHYTVAVRMPQSPSSTLADPKWILFDDHHVSNVSHAWVMFSLSEKATTSSTAYILLYELQSTPL